MKKLSYIIFLVLFCYSLGRTQNQDKDIRTQYSFRVEHGDTIYEGLIQEVIIYPPMQFKNDEEREMFNRLVYDVRKVYPYSVLVSNSIIETYKFMQTLPNDKARQKHMKEVEKYMMDTYKPQLKKLNRRQGQLLIKLIDRQSNSTSYEIIKALMGSFKAGAYNLFAGLFGNSLKTEYDPTGKDREIERIVSLIERRQL